jgi:CBS domain containing-hemolysin-like protein
LTKLTLTGPRILVKFWTIWIVVKLDLTVVMLAGFVAFAGLVPLALAIAVAVAVAVAVALDDLVTFVVVLDGSCTLEPTFLV